MAENNNTVNTEALEPTIQKDTIIDIAITEANETLQSVDKRERIKWGILRIHSKGFPHKLLHRGLHLGISNRRVFHLKVISSRGIHHRKGIRRRAILRKDTPKNIHKGIHHRGIHRVTQRKATHKAILNKATHNKDTHKDSHHQDLLQVDDQPLTYDPESRNSFVALVMSIVAAMLLVTAGFIVVVLTSEDLREFFEDAGIFIMIPAVIGLLICQYAFMCSPCARNPPCSIFILILAVVCMSVIAAKISAHYETKIVVYAFFSTAAIVACCVGLACTSFDFTAWLLYVVVIGFAFFAISMVIFMGMMITGTYMKPVHLAILIVGTLIQTVMLVIELQMILGGKAVEIGESDYAMAAFMLYTSIMDIFIKMVQILGLLDD
ncbi:protein lifeguard 3-like [Anticarsia gemmatalis]|uniref:protein lifeguard 3-like n=1 Tax=Anticarsia gemmatalis TaxID=129554 RepID=UPI003F77217C